MPGKLRRRHGSDGLARETPETSVLPLLELAALRAGLPGALDLGHELAAAGYWEGTVVEQWNAVHDALEARAREASDPLGPVLSLAVSEESRVRFFAPGLLSGVLREQPETALRLLRPLAADPDARVAEAAQAFGVRPFAHALGPEIVPVLQPWIADGDPAVRRAAVEGARPRGVWVKSLAWATQSPALLLPLLEPLRRDDSRFVANAVGNSLNDVSKDHPALVLEIAARWASEPDPGPWQGRIVAKATRTLIKEGHPLALRLLGFEDLDVRARARLLSPRDPRVQPNTNLLFELFVDNHGPACDATLVYEIETTGRVAGRPRRKRYHAGVLRLPEADTLHVRCRERVFDRRAAPLLDGPARCRFFLNGSPVASVEFAIRRCLEYQAE